MRRRLLPLGAAGLLGFATWALSPAITGSAEPWDAPWPFFMVTGVLSGLTLGLAFPSRVIAIYVGVWSGQMAALAVLPWLDRGWLVLGVFTTAIGSLVFLAAAVTGSGLRRLAFKPRHPSPSESEEIS